MPICKRDTFDLNQTESKNETFHDNDLVFCCYITKRIFRDYDNYFRHVMAINSTVWQCEETGKDGLTFEEALKSERAARKKLEQFKQSLRAPVLMVIEQAHQSAAKTLNLIVSKFLRKRFFINEDVIVRNKKNAIYKVVSIKLGANMPKPGNDIYEDTEQLEYCLRASNGDEIFTLAEQLRRQSTEFNMENLAMFIKSSVTRVDGILRPKPDVYKQYVTGPNLTFSNIFIGKMPQFSPAKIKRPDDTKKQSTLNKYIVKNEESTTKNKANAKLAIEMERLRAEKLEKSKAELQRQKELKQKRLEEIERQKAQKKAELILRVEEECNLMTMKTDDLTRTDQRMLPTYHPVVTLLPDKMLGDAFMLREFMHTYRGLLSGVEVFRQNLSFYEMTRALSAREVAGPLSDILLVLLGTIFDLQKEEEEENQVYYATGYTTATQEPYISMANASRTHMYVKRHFGFKINELPLDALTLTEVLRLHLLSSGASVQANTDKWRIMYRMGYASREDPGMHLRLQYPNILHALKTNLLANLDFEDIMCIINCLMAQILTYSATINIIEERMEKMNKAKTELRALDYAENRRQTALEMNKRKLTSAYHQQCMSKDIKDDTNKKQELSEQLNRSIADLSAQSQRDLSKHHQHVLKLHAELFNFLVYLGMDRCYRKYYVLESMPGIFIEHVADVNTETCLDQPPLNKSPVELQKQAQLPKQRKDLRIYLLKLYGEDDKKPRKSTNKQSVENKENQEHHLNGHGENSEPMDVTGEDEETQSAPTQYELFMCTGDPGNCIVHNQKHSQRQLWSYIYQPEELDALINSLNPLGFRESELLGELTQLRSLIAQHVKSCPEEWFNLSTDNKRKKFESAMHVETQRKYSQANFGLPENTELDEVMRLHLVDRILQFEGDIYSGDLGRLKVKDMVKWRKDLVKDGYDAQGKLQWGAANSENELEEIYDDQEDEAGHGTQINQKRYVVYKDPGSSLTATDAPSITQSETHKTHIRNLASALLQVEQGIGRRFIKEPFGMPKKRDSKLEYQKFIYEAKLQQWEVSLMESTSYSQIFLHLSVLHDCILWKHSANKSLCRVCRRGTDPEKMLLCDQCNAGTHMFCMKPKMRTVPEGNWYCHICVRELGMVNASDDKKKTRAGQKKRMFIVDEVEEDDDVDEDDDDSDDEEEEGENEGEEEEEEEEFAVEPAELNEDSKSDSDEEIKRRARIRRNAKLKSKEIAQLANEDDSDAAEDSSVQDEAEVDEDDNEKAEEGQEEKGCQVCFYDGCEIQCMQCSDWYHLECAKLLRPPRKGFVCKKCKPNEVQKTRRRHSHVDGDADDDGDQEPQAKRSRSSRNSLRMSLDKSSAKNNNNNNNNSTSNNNNRRSGRRTNDHLPLNSATLYDLLEQTMKHQEAWPFLRPVLSSEVPDYHKIVKTPMDLAKIKSKLNMGEYQLNEELLNDIQLVFRNCDLYNVEGNEIYDAGSKLERFVMARCKDMMLPFRPSEMNTEAIC